MAINPDKISTVIAEYPTKNINLPVPRDAIDDLNFCKRPHKIAIAIIIQNTATNAFISFKNCACIAVKIFLYPKLKSPVKSCAIF